MMMKRYAKRRIVREYSPRRTCRSLAIISFSGSSRGDGSAPIPPIYSAQSIRSVYETAQSRASRILRRVGMQLDERMVGDIAIITVTGDITLNKGGDVVLKDKVRSLLQQARVKLLLDLGAVSYVDSAGLGELVQAY